MTIKEMEEKTGMSRANIRYYEAEGLLCPARKDNGYRVYSEADADSLLKIKLLRAVGLSLDDIKSLQSGSAALGDALQQHTEVLSRQQTQLERTQLVVQQMLSAGEDFATLNTAPYLLTLETGVHQALKQDVPPHYNLPWRRYWARCFDFSLYSNVVQILLPSEETGFQLLMTLLVMLLVEPLLLHLFGTTPGKAILGIRVTDVEGGRMRYMDALERTWLVLWEGEGLRIPLISLYFLYKNYTKAENGEMLPWENHSELIIQDDENWRYAIFSLAIFLKSALLVWIGV